tara:strand:- start:401 stop:925 length:525 start_codon:yes stop_codon:yes gene_type:complete
MREKRVEINAKVGYANAIRRALISEIPMICPEFIEIEKNTTAHTDEYIAHRIGLIPFTQIKDFESKVSFINKKDSHLFGSDISGDLIAEHPDVKVLDITMGQELSCTIHFCKSTATEHSRFTRTVAVGMRTIDETKHLIKFESLLDDDEDECLVIAIDAVESRLLRALEYCKNN